MTRMLLPHRKGMLCASIGLGVGFMEHQGHNGYYHALGEGTLRRWFHISGCCGNASSLTAVNVLHDRPQLCYNTDRENAHRGLTYAIAYRTHHQARTCHYFICILLSHGVLPTPRDVYWGDAPSIACTAERPLCLPPCVELRRCGTPYRPAHELAEFHILWCRICASNLFT